MPLKRTFCSQVRRIHGSGDVAVAAANVSLGGGVVAEYEHGEVSLDGVFTDRLTAFGAGLTQTATLRNNLPGSFANAQAAQMEDWTLLKLDRQEASVSRLELWGL